MYLKENMINIVKRVKRMAEFLGHSEYLITLSLSLSQVLAYSGLYIIMGRGHPRQYAAFLASMQGKPHCFLYPSSNIELFWIFITK